MSPLHLLADHDRELEAPRSIEGRVIAHFRARKRRRLIWMSAAGTAAASIALLFFALPSEPEATLQIRVSAPMAPTVPVIEARQLLPVKSPRQISSPREVVTQFFPLMNPAPPFERGQLLRVDVPASEMRSVGLPVREERLSDRVQADVLVGEEGMPRAIRFVNFETK